jgi:hypothetical protein
MPFLQAIQVALEAVTNAFLVECSLHENAQFPLIYIELDLVQY